MPTAANHYRRASPASRADLPAKFLAIAADEFEHASYQIGARILNLYLRDLAEAEIMRLTRDPTEIRKIFDKILTEDKAAEKISVEGLRLSTIKYYPTPRTRDALIYLTNKITSQKDLSGIRLAECCRMLAQDLQHRIKPKTLYELLKRNQDYHKLCVRRDRVRLQSDMVVQILGAKHQAQKADAIAEVIKRRNRERKLEAAQLAGKVSKQAKGAGTGRSGRAGSPDKTSRQPRSRATIKHG